MNNTAQRLKRITVVNTIFLVLPSYILHYYLDVEINILFTVLGGVCLLITFHENRLRLVRGVLMMVLTLCSIGAIGSMFSGAFSQLLMAISLSLSFFIATHGWSLFADRRTLRYLLLLGWMLIAGAIFAFLYAFFGGPPVAKIQLYTRETYLYVTTFTNAVNGNLIRAAGIFDEPGALAMFLTVIVALNEAFRTNTKWSAVLLFAGLVTGSFALLFVAIVYLFVKGHQKSFALILIILAAVVMLIIFNETASTLADNFFFNRLEVVDGRLSGDNRTQQIESFLRTVDWNMTLIGQKNTGYYYGELDSSSNPFSIYYGYGIFIWIPYIILELWLLYCFFFYRPHLRFSALAMFLTLLQRPYLYNLHWSAMIAVVVVTIYRVQRIAVAENKNKSFLSMKLTDFNSLKYQS